MKLKHSEYLVDEVEKKILAPSNFNKLNLKRLDSNEINSAAIHEPTLNNTLIYLFSKTIESTPDGVIVWDWELPHIEVLLSGEVLRLDQINIKNLHTTVDISIEIWLD